MKTNPWMILSLVLACVCGFLVGVLVSQPGEVLADEQKPEWTYLHDAMSNAFVRIDTNLKDPHPEFFIIHPDTRESLNYRIKHNQWFPCPESLWKAKKD